MPYYGGMDSLNEYRKKTVTIQVPVLRLAASFGVVALLALSFWFGTLYQKSHQSTGATSRYTPQNFNGGMRGFGSNGQNGGTSGNGNGSDGSNGTNGSDNSGGSSSGTLNNTELQTN
jgi:uncharacterized membrane protein YgcG